GDSPGNRSDWPPSPGPADDSDLPRSSSDGRGADRGSGGVARGGPHRGSRFPVPSPRLSSDSQLQPVHSDFHAVLLDDAPLRRVLEQDRIGVVDVGVDLGLDGGRRRLLKGAGGGGGGGG